ncbi:MAG: ABC transporter substrate-binding protein [Chloroflexaceae bacterium]|jgi:peptide/nickel transport system substrate-binding protein|nr:ABC transporter substrate-binding protein [Chloroflexaceae bacterium]
MRKHIAVPLMLLVLLLNACSQATPPSSAPTVAPPAAAPAQNQPAATVAPVALPTNAPAAQPTTGTFAESPMLADMVKAGTLPAVSARLPEQPLVVQTVTDSGTYGDKLRFGFTGTNPGWGGLWFVNGWEGLTAWKPDFSGIQPNIAESWEVSADAREYTFKLRKGMKWSDGQPFTTDDIMFYIEDMLFDKDVSPGGPVADWLPQDGAKDFKATKIDDTTIKFTFAKPYGTFLYQLATWNGRNLAFYPKHYLQQFHIKYNPNVDELVQKEEGVKDWANLLNKKAAGMATDIQEFYNMPERPLLFPWTVKQPLGTGTTIVLERNPYYWKVDAKGNQLPYIDQIVGTSYQNAEARTLAMLNGDLDIIKDPGDENRSLYYDAMQEGKPLDIKQIVSDGGNTISLHFNRTTADPVKAEIFANKDFRIGLSYAIDRKEIIEVVFQGQGEPAQVAPLEDSPLYNERMATQYLELDLAKANEHLDKILPNKDSEGFRLDKNGKRLSIVFTVVNDASFATQWTQVAELLTKQWARVGVEIKLNSIANKQFDEASKQQQLEATLWSGEGGAGLTPILEPRYYVPMTSVQSLFGVGWFYWNVKSTDAKAVEPPADIKAFYQSYQDVVSAPTEAEQLSRMQALLNKAADEFWTIGISRPAPSFQPIHTRLGNFPDSYVGGWTEGVLKITQPEQWYVKK